MKTIAIILFTTLIAMQCISQTDTFKALVIPKTMKEYESMISNRSYLPCQQTLTKIRFEVIKDSLVMSLEEEFGHPFKMDSTLQESCILQGIEWITNTEIPFDGSAANYYKGF